MTTERRENRVAVIVAHADDEVLGCGGTIMRHTLAGDDVRVVVLADGEGGRSMVAVAESPELQNQIAQRRAAAHRAAEILGVQNTCFYDFPDNRLDTQPLLDIIKVIEDQIREFVPDTVYTHHAGDVNIDHQLVHKAVVTACRPSPDHPVERLLFFEVVSSTEWQPANAAQAFIPNWFVDIDATLAQKMAALRCYVREMRVWPHPRSYEGVEQLARWRGAMVGCRAAESFILGRNICRKP